LRFSSLARSSGAGELNLVRIQEQDVSPRCFVCSCSCLFFLGARIMPRRDHVQRRPCWAAGRRD
jgi:hypothetical protein